MTFKSSKRVYRMLWHRRCCQQVSCVVKLPERVSSGNRESSNSDPAYRYRVGRYYRLIQEETTQPNQTKKSSETTWKMAEVAESAPLVSQARHVVYCGGLSFPFHAM